MLLQRQVGNQAVAQLLSGRSAVPAARLVAPASDRLLQRARKKGKQPAGKQGAEAPATGRRQSKGKKSSSRQRQAQHAKGRDAFDEDQTGDEKRKVRVPQPHGGQPSKQDWALAATQAQKQAIMKGYHVPSTWKDAALHHKISKETLAGIVDAFGLVEAVRVGNAGACEFWKACRDAAGPDIIAQSGENPYKLLWNIAMNLALGPLSPAGDPGTGFDPDTVPAGDGRQLDRVSGYLNEIEAAYHAYGGDEPPIRDDVWTSMAKAMRKAFDAAPHGVSLAPPMTEQWIHDERRHLRKGLKVHRGLEEARQLLADRRGFDDDRRGEPAAQDGQPQGGQPEGSEGITCFAGTWPESRLRLVISPEAIRHICERHTYRYFDFNEIKAVNNFWRGATSVAWVRNRMGELAPDLASRCLEILQQQHMAFLKGEEHEPKEIKEGNQDLGGCSTFFIVNIEPDEVCESSGESSESAGESSDQAAGSSGKALAAKRVWRDVVGKVKTVAPDGKDADFVLASDLRKIGEGLAGTSVRRAAVRGRESGDAGGASRKGKDRLRDPVVDVGERDVDAAGGGGATGEAGERAVVSSGGRYSSGHEVWKTVGTRFVTKDLLPAMAAKEKQGNPVWINDVAYRVVSTKSGKLGEVTGMKVTPVTKPKAPTGRAGQIILDATGRETKGERASEGEGPDDASIPLDVIEVESDGVCLLNALVASGCELSAEELLTTMKAVASDVLIEHREFSVRSDNDRDSSTEGGTGKSESVTDEDFWSKLTIKQLKQGGWGRNTFDLAVLIAARALRVTIHVCTAERTVQDSFRQGAPELWVIYYPEENHFNGARLRRPA